MATEKNPEILRVDEIVSRMPALRVLFAEYFQAFGTKVEARPKAGRHDVEGFDLIVLRTARGLSKKVFKMNSREAQGLLIPYVSEVPSYVSSVPGYLESETEDCSLILDDLLVERMNHLKVTINRLLNEEGFHLSIDQSSMQALFKNISTDGLANLSCDTAKSNGASCNTNQKIDVSLVNKNGTVICTRELGWANLVPIAPYKNILATIIRWHRTWNMIKECLKLGVIVDIDETEKACWREIGAVQKEASDFEKEQR